MPYLTLNQAAKAAKKSKSAILEAIRSGRMSAAQNELKQWQIDPVELFRVYPPKPVETGRQNRNLPPTEPQPTTPETTHYEFQMQILEAERSRERAQLLATIEDLRARLDQETNERRKLTAMLMIQQQPKPDPVEPKTSLLLLKLFGRRA